MLKRKKTGLVLGGGGARAAYQVGVLQAIAARSGLAGLIGPGARDTFAQRENVLAFLRPNCRLQLMLAN